MTLMMQKKICMQNILIWLSGRAVKTQLQIVLIRLFAATDGCVKIIFFLFFQVQPYNRKYRNRVWSMSFSKLIQ